MSTARRKPRNYEFLAKFTWYVPGIGGMFALLAMLLVGALIGNLLSLPIIAILPDEDAMQFATLVSYPVMFIPAMIYASVKSHNASMTQEGVKMDNSNYGRTGGLLCALLVVLATLATAFCMDAVNAAMPPVPEALKYMLEGLTGGPVWISLLCVSVFAPFFEEWLCRGMVLRGLLYRGIKPVWAVIISAAFFALIHLNPWQAVPAFALGCLFGYIYYKTGSLKLTMLMHCANNTMAVIVSNISSLEEAENWMDIMPGASYWILFAAFIIMTALIINVFSRIETTSEKGSCETVPSIFEQ